MIFGLILDSDKEEEKLICRYLRNLTARYTDEKLEIKVICTGEAFAMHRKTTGLLDVAIIDVTLRGALEEARMIRKEYPKTEILVIADLSVSPMAYMHPSIRASALLLRPVTGEWEKAIRDFFLPLLQESPDENQENVLWIENREGTFRIPFDQIFYLEAREKKIFIRTRTEEFGISGTMDKLEGKLPDNFKRCHRSFIVNANHIVKIKLSENMLYLREELFVPVSRSYRDVFKRPIYE